MLILYRKNECWEYAENLFSIPYLFLFAMLLLPVILNQFLLKFHIPFFFDRLLDVWHTSIFLEVL